MNVKYGDSNSYLYKLTDEELQLITDKTWRSKTQTQFLYNLCDGDLTKLCKLEEQLKNSFVGYCPGTVEDVERILMLKPKSNNFKLVL